MAEYGYIEKALLGMKVDNDQTERIESWAAQEDIDFGWPVFSYLGETEKVYGYHIDTAKIVYSADFVTGNLIDGTINTVAWTQVPFNTDHDTTMDDLVSAISSLEGVEAVLDSTDVNNRTIYVRTKGLDIAVTSVVTGGASQATATITYQSDQVFIGIAGRIAKGVDIVNDCKFYQYQTVSVVNTGVYWCVSAGTNNNLDIAYLTSTGGDSGKYSSTAGIDINCIFKSNNYTNPDTGEIMTAVKINGSKKLNAEIAWA